MPVSVGTITFLFTDIEGSTRLWEEHSTAMRQALARHDALLREVITRHQGHVFKTIGDAFCAAFDNPAAALDAALEAQCMLIHEAWPAETPLKVRMALHTGTAESRDGDYFGQPLNRITRLLMASHGGQVLITQATYDLIGDSLPNAAALRDLGQHQFKDLAHPEQVYQLQHPELPDSFPPIKSLSTHSNNLPQQLTSFIGREKELAEIKSLLRCTRVLSLTGSGGSGKTRLSLQVAADSLEFYPDGVWLIELAPLSDPAFIPRTLAEVLGVREAVGEMTTQALTRTLREKRLLLVLDNCEHVLDAIAALVTALTRVCPHLTVLASSREALGISGESVYRVPSLSLPLPTTAHTAESLSHFEAVRLFIDRAVAAKEDFSVTNESAPALASICFRLDGIPLAIELAAARVRALPLEQLEQRLSNCFRVLTGGSRTALPRQQTLRALIDWSYDLLNAQERALLCRLAVFSGGWKLESSEAICVGGEVEDGEVLDLLTSLLDKSLVVYEERQGTARYRLLETVRQYARERLLDSGAGEATRARHRDYFLAFAQEAGTKLVGPTQTHWMQQLEREHDNLRTALEFCLSEPASVPLGQTLAGALWKFWWNRGHLTEGREWYERTLAQEGGEAPTQARAAALHGASVLAGAQTDYAAAERYGQQSLDLRRALDDKRGMSASLNSLGNSAFFQADYATAQRYHEASLTLKRELGDKSGISISLNNLGNIAHQRGDLATALRYHEESLALKQELGDKNGVASSLLNLGNIAQRQSNNEAARAYFQQSLRTRQELEDRFNVIICLESLANLALDEKNFSHAALLWGAATRLKEEIGTATPHSIQESHLYHLKSTRAGLGDDAFEAVFARGHGLTLEEAIARALEN
ncbi:tetratricopeptide repeat protein [Armatimonas sp.]|uniref:tetratricopeptide repeat protein n=1 Tax=Armatimonas sp. TaxID=1872638 RepID=UPI00286A502C|nr:tetratricopeptide repeat protein [Armatimonas sp.]